MKESMKRIYERYSMTNKQKQTIKELREKGYPVTHKRNGKGSHIILQIDGVDTPPIPLPKNPPPVSVVEKGIKEWIGDNITEDIEQETEVVEPVEEVIISNEEKYGRKYDSTLKQTTEEDIMSQREKELLDELNHLKQEYRLLQRYHTEQVGVIDLLEYNEFRREIEVGV